MKYGLALIVAFGVAGCWEGSESPPNHRAFGLAGKESAIASSDACAVGAGSESYNESAFSTDGFATGLSYSIRIATNTPEAPTLTVSEDTARVVRNSRVEVPLDGSHHQYSSPPIVHTWVFDVEVLSAGDAALIVERGGEEIDRFSFPTREPASWDIDDSAVSFLMTGYGRERRALAAYGENGGLLAHSVKARWSSESPDVVVVGNTAAEASGSVDGGCVTLVRAGVGETTVSVSSPVGEWAIDVTVE
jgi:hypothetical protein